MSQDALDSCVDGVAEHEAVASDGELMECEATPEEATEADFSPAGSTFEPRAGKPSLAPQAMVWNSWLLTLNGRTAPGPSLPTQRPPPLPREPARHQGSTPTVSEEVYARSTVFDAATAIQWQKLWLATQRRPWRSLAVVPVGGGIATPRVARALAEVGSAHLGPGMMVTDATNVTLEWLQASMESWTKSQGRIDRMLIALGPVLERPASLAIARAADASILCLVLGEGSISEATRTIEEVGRDRFLGSVILRPRKNKTERR